MAASADDFDLGALRLSAGQGRRLELAARIAPLVLGNETYTGPDERVPAIIDVSRMTGQGYALRLRFEAPLSGPCMRCLTAAAPTIVVDAREVDQPGGGDELSSPYVENEVLDVAGWAREAFALAVPTKVLCQPDCAGLCPICAVNLNEAGPEHHHEPEPDPRWDKLRELRF